MLDKVLATRYVKPMDSGRTSPCLFECEDANGNLLEAVVKYTGMMMEKEKNLAIEAFVAMLGADLKLPVAEPFVVELDPALIDAIDDATVRDKLKQSCPEAFGSRLHTGMAAWPRDQNVPAALTQQAAEVLLFDEIIENWDRRVTNPNCMFAGERILIIDHELAFQRLLFWVAPWHDGGLRDINVREHHIFAGPYFEKVPTEFDRFVQAWESIPDERFNEYKTALPKAWLYDEAHIDSIVAYLKLVKSNIRTIAAKAVEALK